MSKKDKYIDPDDDSMPNIGDEDAHLRNIHLSQQPFKE